MNHKRLDVCHTNSLKKIKYILSLLPTKSTNNKSSHCGAPVLWLNAQAQGGCQGDPNVFPHIYSSCVEISQHTKNQLYTLCGRLLLGFSGRNWKKFVQKRGSIKDLSTTAPFWQFMTPETNESHIQAIYGPRNSTILAISCSGFRVQKSPKI